MLRKLAQSLPTQQQIDGHKIVEDALAIQQIPAPTFAEDRRAAYVKERFAQHSLQDIAIDDVFNVYGRWPGVDAERPSLIVSAHLDTVFPLDTSLAIRHENGKTYGPGLGDNSLGVAALLALLDILETHQLRPASDIWFVANSREEGLGDLGGIRAAWNKLGARLGAAIVVEGMALGRIYHAGIGVRRLHITCRAPGGHSWLHFGQPTAIHGLIELGARIIALTPPEQPRTTYNIGLISGGQSVNSLASEADLYLDLRSEEVAHLRALEKQVLEAIEAVRRPGLSFDTQVVGDRPAGQISQDHPLVQLAVAALDEIGHPPTFENGSTDANFPLAQGLPTVTVGVTYGGNAHRLDEYIETDPIPAGIWQLALLMLAAADQLHTWAGL
jgi:acetylornithine deacetylase/succinyl-diaminopimelate desuccinylase-like protein